jgi:hypothetical protein
MPPVAKLAEPSPLLLRLSASSEQAMPSFAQPSRQGFNPGEYPRRIPDIPTVVLPSPRGYMPGDMHRYSAGNPNVAYSYHHNMAAMHSPYASNPPDLLGCPIPPQQPAYGEFPTFATPLVPGSLHGGGAAFHSNSPAMLFNEPPQATHPISRNTSPLNAEAKQFTPIQTQEKKENTTPASLPDNGAGSGAQATAASGQPLYVYGMASRQKNVPMSSANKTTNLESEPSRPPPAQVKKPLQSRPTFAHQYNPSMKHKHKLAPMTPLSTDPKDSQNRPPFATQDAPLMPQQHPGVKLPLRPRPPVAPAAILRKQDRAAVVPKSAAPANPKSAASVMSQQTIDTGHQFDTESQTTKEDGSFPWRTGSTSFEDMFSKISKIKNAEVKTLEELALTAPVAHNPFVEKHETIDEILKRISARTERIVLAPRRNTVNPEASEEDQISRRLDDIRFALRRLDVVSKQFDFAIAQLHGLKPDAGMYSLR